MSLTEHIAAQAERVNRHPTEPQKEAGNYQKGHLSLHGLGISIENPRGSFRSGVGKDGKPWRSQLPHHYGYIKRTEGADGDHVDVFVGPHPRSGLVYVIDQNDAETGRFDEHKAFVGFSTAKQVKRAYEAAFSDGRAKARLGHLHEMTMAQFKDWLRDGDTTKPLKHGGRAEAEKALPPNHQLGMKVPSGGSMCANCRFLSSPTTCGNDGFVKWNGGDKLPEPAHEYCCDLYEHGKQRADGGRIGMAGGGIPKFEDTQPVDSSGPPPFEQTQPVDNGFSWSRAITDIPSEIGKEASSAAGDIGALANRASMGPIEGAMTTGKAVAAVPRLLLSPFTGAARSVVGRTMGNVEHKIGEYINPQVAAQQNPEDVYSAASSDVDKALMAARPGRLAPGPVPPVPETVGDFSTPLTVGEASRSMPDIAAEQRALRGGEGTPAQRVAQARMDARNAHLEGVREDIGRTFDPYGGSLTETPYEAGDMVQRGVQSAAQSARDLYNQRYEEMRSLPGEFHAGAFEGIGQKIRGQLTLGDNPVIVDDRTTPIASQMLKDVDQQIGSLRIQNRADPFGAPDPQNITSVSLQGVDQARKRLVSMYKDARAYPPDADTRAAQAVLKAFDDQVEGALTQGLFSGDERALDALREARGAYSTYKNMFGPRGTGDDVGRAMQHILGGPNREAASPTQMANYLYGTANVGASGLSYRLAQRLRDVLGEASPEWSAVKQGLWQRLTERPEGVQQWGPQQVQTRIAKFLNGDGAPLANRVFSPVERSLIQRYGDLMQRMVPPPGAVNYSNNLQWAAHFRDQAVKYISAAIGEKLGGPIGGVVGYGIGAATQPAVNVMKARKVANSMPTVAESMERWDQAVRAASRRGLPGTPMLTAATGHLVSQLRNIGVPETALRALATLQGTQPATANQPTGVTTSSGQFGAWPQRARGGQVKRRPFDDGGAIGNPMGEVVPPAPDDGRPWNPVGDVASNLAQQVTTPGSIMKPNPYPPGSEEADYYDALRSKAMTDWAPQMALNTMGTGAIAGVPVKGAEAVLGAGFTRPLYHGSPEVGLKVLNESDRGPLGPGVYTSPAEQIAGSYAREGGTLYELPQRERDIYTGAGHHDNEGWAGFKDDQTRLINAAYDDGPEKWKAVRDILSGMWSNDGYPTYQRIVRLYGSNEAAQNLFKRAGFEGISGLVDGPETLLFGPQKLTPSIRAYHGSPHDFDAFDLSKIGTGEGAQAYGHGLYFAEKEGTAQSYKDALGGDAVKIGDDVFHPPAGSPEDIAAAHLHLAHDSQSSSPYGYALKSLRSSQRYATPEQSPKFDAAANVLADWQERGATPVSSGRMYEVNINADPEHFLDWDKPLSEQSEQVRETLKPHLEAFDAGMQFGAQKTEGGYYPVATPGPDAHPSLTQRVYRKVYPTRTDASTAAADLWRQSSDGQKLMAMLSRQHGQEGATQWLREQGIPGIKYLDQGSRGSGTGTKNFVVFDDQLIKIMRKYGMAGLIAAGAGHFALPADSNSQ